MKEEGGTGRQAQSSREVTIEVAMQRAVDNQPPWEEADEGLH
jgi:hypothetical protein